MLTELLAENKQLKSKNKRLKKEKTKSLNDIKTFVMKLSHELKTPLNSIIGYSELLKEKITDDKLSFYADNIQSSSKYMLSIIQNMIDITKYQNNQFTPEYSIFNTKDAIEEVISGFDTENIDYTIIDMLITADYTRFKQMIYNLISNALKFNKRGRYIRIISYKKDNFFYFEITNEGKGIKETDYKNIFKLYSQLSKNKTSGLGIGLALCKAIAESHNGKIWVNSVIDKYTTFTFKIPVTQ